jgi:hypothetical protein
MQRQVHPLVSANLSQVFPSLGIFGNKDKKNRSNVQYKQNLNKFLGKDPAKDQISPRKLNDEITKRLEILK